MKLKSLVVATLVGFALVSCEEKKDHEVHSMDEGMEKTALNVEVVNKIDPICEMEMPKFLSDTMHYQGQVYGFCSASCKEEFSKTPDDFVKQLIEASALNGETQATEDTHNHEDHEGHEHE